MKKLAAVAVAVALLLSAAGLAFEGEGYPAWDGTTVPNNGLCGSFGADRIQLNFDPSSDYSNVEDGLIQACFYAYDAAELHYLELYLYIPDGATAGEVFRSGENGPCSLFLYETSMSDEVLYYAGIMGEAGAEEGSYELTVESVERNDASISMQGKLSARLCRYDFNQPSRELLSVDDAHFNFTLSLAAAPQPSATPAPEATFPAAPEQSEAPDFPALPGQTEAPGFYFPGTPQESAAPSATFPALPGETEAPGFYFPGAPQESAAPGATFPGLPKDAPSGGGPAFTLPPDYATI